jgi:hypothetical protein
VASRLEEDSIAGLMRAPSSTALPQLVTEGFTAHAALWTAATGSTKSSSIFTSCAGSSGGLIVIDDNWAPSVRTAVRYYEQNLGWTVIPDAFARGTVVTNGAGPTAEPVTRCKALRLPDPSFEPPSTEFHPF